MSKVVINKNFIPKDAKKVVKVEFVSNLKGSSVPGKVVINRSFRSARTVRRK